MILDPSQWKILLVDDEPDNIGVAQLALEFHKAQVTAVTNGQAALEELKKELPTLVLLDIQMPKVSGWDVLKFIRETPALKDLTVIALTAHAMSGDRERILTAGFDGYIPKPMMPSTLVDLIKEVLQAKEKISGSPAPIAVSQTIPTNQESQPSVRVEASTPETPMWVLLVDDDPDARNVFQLVMDHHKLRLTVMEDAKSALEFLRHNSPDVIVMDIFLPDLDGYEALQQIRKSALVPNSRVVASTAYHVGDTQKDVLSWGFSGYLPKPINATKLVSYLRQIMEQDLTQTN